MPAPVFVAFRHDNIFKIRRISVSEILEEFPDSLRKRQQVTAVNLTIGKRKSTKISKTVAKDNIPNRAAGTAKAFIQFKRMLRRFGPIPVSYTHLDVYKRQALK